MKTTNQVLEELRKAKPDMRVYFAFAHCIPTDVDSWRGVYAEPALGWKPSGYSGHVEKYPLVADVIKELEGAINGRSFDGWKGGYFTYTGDETLHIDNSGDCTNTEIERIEIGPYCVIIHTTTEDDH